MSVLRGNHCEFQVLNANQRDWFSPLAVEAWLSTYDAVATATDVDFLFSELQLESAVSVLDIGCGHGRHVREITARSDLVVCGIDSSTDMVKIARSNTVDPVSRIEYFAVSVESVISCTPRFSCAYSFGTSFGYHADFKLRVWLRSIWSMLLEDSYFLIETVLVAECFLDPKRTFRNETNYGCVNVRRLEHFDSSNKILRTSYRYSKGKTSECVERDFRVYSIKEITNTAEQAGFGTEKIYNRQRNVLVPNELSSRYAFLLRKVGH